MAWQAEGGVGVGGSEGAAGGVELTDVLSELPTVGVPSTVDLDSQRTGSYGLTRRHPIAASPLRGKLASRFVQSPSEPSGALRGVPSDIPKGGVVATGEVDAGNLQVIAIDVALVERDATIDAQLLVSAAPHRIVGAFHDRIAFTVGERHGAVLGVVFSFAGGLALN